ncbi:hypothetical protein BDV18DRAFT_14944 [Aspergillus unguis]
MKIAREHFQGVISVLGYFLCTCLMDGGYTTLYCTFTLQLVLIQRQYHFYQPSISLGNINMKQLI